MFNWQSWIKRTAYLGFYDRMLGAAVLLLLYLLLRSPLNISAGKFLTFTLILLFIINLGYARPDRRAERPVANIVYLLAPTIALACEGEGAKSIGLAALGFALVEISCCIFFRWGGGVSWRVFRLTTAQRRVNAYRI